MDGDKDIHDNEVYKKTPYQPPSSKSVPSEASEESVWITLAILGSTILITMYGETMLLPAIRDIISDFHISYSTSSGYLQHILSQQLFRLLLLESYPISMDERKWS